MIFITIIAILIITIGKLEYQKYKESMVKAHAEQDLRSCIKIAEEKFALAGTAEVYCKEDLIANSLDAVVTVSGDKNVEFETDIRDTEKGSMLVEYDEIKLNCYIVDKDSDTETRANCTVIGAIN